ncbi:MAG: hypothetical protein ACLTCB_01450 [Merdibacter sp.]
MLIDEVIAWLILEIVEIPWEGRDLWVIAIPPDIPVIRGLSDMSSLTRSTSGLSMSPRGLCLREGRLRAGQTARAA